MRRQANQNHRAALLNEVSGAVDEHRNRVPHGLVAVAVGDDGVNLTLTNWRAPAVVKHKRRAERNIACKAGETRRNAMCRRSGGRWFESVMRAQKTGEGERRGVMTHDPPMEPLEGPPRRIRCQTGCSFTEMHFPRRGWPTASAVFVLVLHSPAPAQNLLRGDIRVRVRVLIFDQRPGASQSRETPRRQQTSCAENRDPGKPR